MKSFIHLTLVLAAALIVSDTRAQSPPTAVSSSAGVLLLRNGQTLEGNITRTGDYYLVTRGVTSEVRLPAISVELVCPNMDALYRYKIAALPRGNSEGHLELARWCLQHDLVDRAADQALMAFALDPNAAGLEFIERQILATERPAEDADAAAGDTRSAPTLREVEQAIEVLPPGTIQQFVTSVQPLLMNRCAANGCHGSNGDSAFKLLRPAARQSLPRRMTQRNLFATLAYVDRDNPLQSQLLSKSKSSHGGREAVFSEAETHQIHLLAKWITDLARQPLADLPESVTRPPAVLLQTRPDAMAELANAFSSAETAAADETPRAGQGQNPAEEYQPRDPFDPEIFNRRFPQHATDPK